MLDFVVLHNKVKCNVRFLSFAPENVSCEHSSKGTHFVIVLFHSFIVRLTSCKGEHISAKARFLSLLSCNRFYTRIDFFKVYCILSRHC